MLSLLSNLSLSSGVKIQENLFVNIKIEPIPLSHGYGRASTYSFSFSVLITITIIITTATAEWCRGSNTYQKEVGDIDDNNGCRDHKTTLSINVLIQQNNKTKCHSTMQTAICHDKLIDIIQLDDMQMISKWAQQQNTCKISVILQPVSLPA